MTCVVPSSSVDLFHSNEKYFPKERSITWVRKHHIENELVFSSDEEVHVEYSTHEKQSLDRLKEIQDLSMRATLLNAEHRYADQEPITSTRKRRITDYNSSPDRCDYQQDNNGHYKLTLSQFAVSAAEQEPLYPDDEDVEEILMRLRHGHDYYRPQTPTPSFPLLFPAHASQIRPYYCDPRPQCVPQMPYPQNNNHNKASLFHILSNDQPEVPVYPQPHSHTVHNLHMRKLFFEDGLMESSDFEQDLEHHKAKKVRRETKVKSPSLKSIVVNGDDVQEKETVAAGLCFKTHKPKVQREYYYAKLSKTIFRWTCCGSQAKTHPDA